MFWPGPVSGLTGVDEADLSDAFRRLEDRELVFSRAGSTWSGQPEYLFKHILTRDVAYESLPRRDRQAAHRSVADWVERTAGERKGEFAELLAYHYSTAVASVRETGDAPDPELRSAALRWLLRASRDARKRMVVKKAERMAEEALALAVDDLERTDALEALGDAFFDQYKGDLAWRYFREAALVRAGADPHDGARVAYLAARACEVPQRWPGSMRELPPPEAEVEELYLLGLEHAPSGDNAERVRLLGLRAGWAFGYPDKELNEDESEELERAGLEAADMALRIGEPNLASGALDQASAVWVARGWYGRAYPIWKRRMAIIPQISDVLEIGDTYSGGAWGLYEMGRYAEAVEVSDAGLEVITGRGANVELHNRSWRRSRCIGWASGTRPSRSSAASGHARGPSGRPAYFVSHSFAASAAIHEARGDRVQSDRFAGLLTRMMGEGQGRLYSWLMRLLVLRGDLERPSGCRAPRRGRCTPGTRTSPSAS